MNDETSVIRTHWLSMNKSDSFNTIELELKKELPIAKALLNSFISISDISFSDINELEKTKSTLKEEFEVTITNKKYLLSKEDIVKCIEIVKEVLKEQATNISIMFGKLSNDFSFNTIDLYSFSYLLKRHSKNKKIMKAAPNDLESIENENRRNRLSNFIVAIEKNDKETLYKLKSIKVFAARALMEINILPKGILDFKANIQKSIIQNCNGKVKSLIECYQRHTEEYNTHEKLYKHLISIFGDDAKTFSDDLYASELLRKVDGKSYAILQSMITSVFKKDLYKDYCDKSDKKWTPSKELYDFIESKKDIIKSFVDNNFNIKTNVEDSDDGQIEYFIQDIINENYWLKTHTKSINKPDFDMSDFGLHLGSNYLKILDIKVVNNDLIVIFNLNENNIEASFKLGHNHNLTYGNDFTISKNENNFNIECHKRVYTNNGKSKKLIKIVGILKEPKLCKSKGVLGIRMPINWSTKIKSDDVNKIKIGKSTISFNTTKFATPKEYKKVIDFRNSLAVDDTIRWAGFDYGENNNVVKIFKSPKYNNESIEELFNVSDNIEEIACYTFEDYQKNKKNVEYSIEPFYELLNTIKYTRSIVSLLNKKAHKIDNKYVDSNYQNCLSTISNKLKSLNIKSLLNSSIELLLKSNSLTFEDVKSNKDYLPNILFKNIKKQYAAIVKNRKGEFQSLHQNDFIWIKCIDAFISLSKSISFFGLPTQKRGENKDFNIKAVKYRDNVIKQYRKELACFLRDACISHNVSLLSIESLKAEKYKNDDSDNNRKRALFAPAELQKDITTACELHNIAIIQINEDLTSRIAPNNTFGVRLKSDWKHLHYKNEDDKIITIDADENACKNIVVRAMTMGASIPKFFKQDFQNKSKKLGPSKKMRMLYYLRKNDSNAYNTIKKKNDNISDAEFEECLKDIKSKVSLSKNVYYVQNDMFIGVDDKKKYLNDIEMRIEIDKTSIPY